MARPRQARSVETRSRLLTAAAGIIAEHGIEGASVDAIAERAERTSGSLYGQFGSKDGLIVELLDRSKDLVARSMFADIEAAATLDE
jgi:AcrR family transcriptional regulator